MDAIDAEVAQLLEDIDNLLKAMESGELSTHSIQIQPEVLHPKSKAAKHQFEHHVQMMFRSQREVAIDMAKTFFKQKRGAKDMAADIAASLYLYFDSLPEQIEGLLDDAADAGVSNGMTQLQVDSSDVIQAAKQAAANYARSRSASLVGLKYNDAGQLIVDPDAQYAISDTTREELESLLQQAVSENWSRQTVIDHLSTAGMFSDNRASLIAENEISMAQSFGQYELWKVSGIVTHVTSVLSDIHDVDDICDDNAGVVVEIGTPFPSGDTFTPFHPYCNCRIEAVTMESGSL